MKTTTKRNVDLVWVLKYLRDGAYPAGLNFIEKRMVRKRAERFCFWKDELYYLGSPTDQSLGKRTRKVLLTEDEKLEKVRECHVDEEGIHLGLERTAEKIMGKYHWNGIYKFIRQFIRQCAICVEKNSKLLANRSTSVSQEAGNEEEMGWETDSVPEVQGEEEEGLKFWSKVILRILGPYKIPNGERKVLVAVDSYSHWVEAFVLDIISADSVANSILQLICRHGKMGALTLSLNDTELVDSTQAALQSLKDDSGIDIPLQPRSSDADEVFKKADELIIGFASMNPSTWPEKIEFCLLPLRMSKQKQQEAGNKKQVAETTVTVEEETSNAAVVLMSVHKAQTDTSNKPTDTATPSTSNVRGIVTRSRTGNTKPKPFDEDNYEVPTPKRKGNFNVIQIPIVRKKARLDPAVPETPVSETPANSNGQTSAAEAKSPQAPVKKIVDLDTYYEAIRMYLTIGEFQDNTTAGFKRLIREKSKNYRIKDGNLYHIGGPKRELKKVIHNKTVRINLMTKSLFLPWSKSSQEALETCHWKSKDTDCDLFLLACPYNDKVDLNKPVKDVSSRTVAEVKKQLAFDTNETYREISNYITYDVFSDDEAAKRLAYIQRQIKHFKMEDDTLVHVSGSKKHNVLLTAKERQAAIAEAHMKKGQHSDVNVTYHQLCETSFWYGMKFDVKVYISLCCTSENKHMLERYFLFREHLMKQNITQKTDDIVEEAEQMEMDQTTEVDNDIEDIQSSQRESVDLTKTTASPSPVRPAGIFVSNMKYVGPLMTSKEVKQAATVTEAGDHSKKHEQEQQEVKDQGQQETILEVEDMDVPHSAILVKITGDGQAIIMREDGTDPSADLHISEQEEDKGSSDVPAAVKSIIQDTDAMNQLYGDSEAETSQTIIPDEADQSGCTTAEEGTNTENIDEEDDDGESDGWMCGSDDDEQQEIADDVQYNSVLESLMHTTNYDKKPVTPRPHFKCSQCNKIFFGPLKFKMHMYKHTGQKPFPCNLCHKKYSNKKSLVLHQKQHTGELPYLCSLCGKRCPSKMSLKSHLKCHDGNGGGFPATCDICQRVFSRKHLMERHKLHKHINLQTEFKCNECNKVFSHQRSLKRHFMSSHLNIKNHVCGLCGKSFYRKEYLTGHLIQHGGAAAEGLTPRKPRPSTFKPRPSVFNQTSFNLKDVKAQSGNVEQFVALQDHKDDEGVERIILTQDEDGQYRVVDVATEREVKRMLEARGINRGEAGETMVVHIEEPSGEPQVVHVEHTEEQVVEVPLEEHSYIEYQQVGEDKPQEFVIAESAVGSSASGSQYIYTTSNHNEMSGNQELIYGQPAVQYEVECVGDVGDDEALSAINLLAQASAQQYENVISQI